MAEDPNAVELRTKITALAERRYGGDLRALFSAYDMDHDGALRAGELDTLFQNADIGTPFTRGMWVQGVMDRMDADHNQALTYAEIEIAIAPQSAPPPGGGVDVYPPGTEFDQNGNPIPKGTPGDKQQPPSGQPYGPPPPADARAQLGLVPVLLGAAALVLLLAYASK